MDDEREMNAFVYDATAMIRGAGEPFQRANGQEHEPGRQRHRTIEKVAENGCEQIGQLRTNDNNTVLFLQSSVSTCFEI